MRGITRTLDNRRGGLVLAAAALSVLAVGLAAPQSAGAAVLEPSIQIDFTAAEYSSGPGSPAAQGGWAQLRAGIDWSLVDNDEVAVAGLPAGGRSLQFSNASNADGGSDLVSPLILPAGEPGTGATANTFDASFMVASATGALQPGLGVDVAIDGASRYGGVVNLRHTAAGLEIGSYWVPASATDASAGSWRSQVFATVPADVPHTIRLVAVFLEGEEDILQIYVDGTLVSGGSGATTWERYHELAQPATDKTVDSISFKAARSAPSADGIGFDSWPVAPDLLGQGFLFTGIGYSVSTTTPPVDPPGPTPLPTTPPVLPTAPAATPDAPVTVPSEPILPGETISFEATGFQPYENVFLTFFSTPQFGGWFQADASGTVRGTVTVPAGLAAGTHTFQLTGSVSGFVAASVFSVARILPATGAEITTGTIVLAAGLLLGGGLLMAARRRSRSAQPLA